MLAGTRRETVELCTFYVPSGGSRPKQSSLRMEIEHAQAFGALCEYLVHFLHARLGTVK